MRTQTRWSWLAHVIVFGVIAVAAAIMGRSGVAFVVAVAAYVIARIVLSRMDLPPGHWFITAGVVLIPLCFIPIVSGLSASEPARPGGLPDEMLDLPYTEDNTVKLTADTWLVIYDGDTTKVRVAFPEITSLGRKWAFTSCTFELEGALTGEYPPAHSARSASWDDVITVYGESSGEIIPVNGVLLPLDEAVRYQRATITGTLDVYYPVESGNQFFEVSETLTRTLDIMIGAPEDKVYIEELDDWEVERRFSTMPGLLFSGGGLLLGLVLLVWGAVQAQGAGWCGEGPQPVSGATSD